MFQKLNCVIIILLLLFLPTKDNYSQDNNYKELQAIYIYNFAKYTTWPDAFHSFTIGVFDDEIMYELIREKLTNKLIKGKPISLKLIYTPEEINNCQIIYLNNSNTKHLKGVLENSQEKNVLIVTENDLIKKGALISFLIVDNRLRFKINNAAMDEKGLIPSKGLLDLALK